MKIFVISLTTATFALVYYGVTGKVVFAWIYLAYLLGAIILCAIEYFRKGMKHHG